MNDDMPFKSNAVYGLPVEFAELFIVGPPVATRLRHKITGEMRWGTASRALRVKDIDAGERVAVPCSVVDAGEDDPVFAESNHA